MNEQKPTVAELEEAMTKISLEQAEAMVKYGMRLSVEEVARMCHGVNRAYCQALGDYSQLIWGQAPAWQRDSAMNGVQFHLDNPDASAAASHESWLKEKQEDGWAYGPTKDEEEKLHPCFVPFHELPVEQQAKDFIFRVIVHAMHG